MVYDRTSILCVIFGLSNLSKNEVQSSLSADELDVSRLEFVVKELLETEKVYIREIEEVILGYGREIDSSSDCPEILQGKR